MMNDQANSANWVQLEGATNVRDVGGWGVSAPNASGPSASEPGAGGRGAGRSSASEHDTTSRIRTGALYRGDRLNNLSEDDKDELASRGIRTVIDFRASDEIQRDPSRLWLSVSNAISLPISERNVQPTALLDRILSRQITSMSEDEMAQVYVNLLNDNAQQFARFITLAADVDNWPMLYHCTAGKDRTGIATALIMELCGADRTGVLDEYCVTNEQRSKRRMAELAEVFANEGIDMEAVKPLLMAPRPVLTQALDYLDGEHGGAEGFLLDAGGLDPTVPTELRVNLLV